MYDEYVQKYKIKRFTIKFYKITRVSNNYSKKMRCGRVFFLLRSSITCKMMRHLTVIFVTAAMENF